LGKKKTERIIPEKIEPKHFKFVYKIDPHDISFRRVGVNAGKIDKDTDNKSIQSHYFIKFINNKSTDDNIKLLEKINFDFNNTVGAKSINKQELIKEFNKYI
jgi:4-hydroxy-3-methylbut-2-en-1-yl diphosphate synthase IspG/GcpE